MELMSGLQDLHDQERLLECLRELNSVLTLGQADIRAGPFIAAILTVLSCEAIYNPEIYNLAARALSTILDIEPRCIRQVISENGLPVLTKKLLEFQDLEVAEQCLNCITFFAKHSKNRPGNFKMLLRADALRACTAFFDFFPRHMRLKALETFSMLSSYTSHGSTEVKCKADSGYVLAVLPALHKWLDATDEQVLWHACLSLTKIVLSYEKCLRRWVGRSSSSSSETTTSWQIAVIRETVSEQVALRLVQILKASTAGDIGPRFQPLLFKALACSVRNCPELAVSLTESRLVIILQQRLRTHSRDQRKFESQEDQQDDPQSGNRTKRLGSLTASSSSLSNMSISSSSSSLSSQESQPPAIDEGQHSSNSGGNNLLQLKRIEQDTANILELIAAFVPPTPSLETGADIKSARELLQASGSSSNSSSSSTSSHKSLLSSEQGALNTEGTDQTSSNSQNRTRGGDAGSSLIIGNMWACPICTFHNSISTCSCEMCGQMCPEIQRRADDAKKRTLPDVDEITAKQKQSSLQSISDVWVCHDKVRKEFMYRLSEELVHVSTESCVLSTQVKALELVGAINFNSSKEDLSHLRHEDSSFSQLGCFGSIASALLSDGVPLVRAALVVILIDLLRVPDITSPVLIREGVIERIREILIRGEPKNAVNLAQICLDEFHISNCRKSHDLDSTCDICSSENHCVVALERICDRIATVAGSRSKDSFDHESTDRQVLGFMHAPSSPCCSDSEADPTLVSSNSRSSDGAVQLSSSERVSGAHRKRRSITHPISTSCGSEKAQPTTSPDSTRRPEKKRRTFSVSMNNSDNRLKNESEYILPDSSEGDLERRAAWVAPLEELKALLVSRRGITLYEMEKSGLIEALQLVFFDANARYVFFEVFCSETNGPLSTLVNKLFSLLHAQEKLHVHFQGGLDTLCKPEYFRVQPTPELVTYIQSVLDSVASGILSTLGGDIYRNCGFKVVDETNTLKLHILAEPLILVSDLQRAIWKRFRINLIRCVLNAEKAALLHVQGSNYCNRIIRPGALVTYGKDWATSGEQAEVDDGTNAVHSSSLQVTSVGTENAVAKHDEKDAKRTNPVGTVLEVCSWKSDENGCAALVWWQHTGEINIYCYGAENKFQIEPFVQMTSGEPEKQTFPMIANDAANKWRNSLGEGIFVDILDTDGIWKHAVVQACVEVGSQQHRILSVNVSNAPGQSRSDTAVVRRWVLNSSPRLAPMGSTSATQITSRQIETIEKEDRDLIKSLYPGTKIDTSKLTPGMKIDVKRGRTGHWFPATVVAVSSERAISVTSPSVSIQKPKYVLVHDLSEDSNVFDQWVDLSSNSVAPILSRTGVTKVSSESSSSGTEMLPVSPAEVLWLIQRIGTLSPLKRQSNSTKKSIKALRPGDTVFVPVFFMDRTSYVLEATIFSLAMNDSPKHQRLVCVGFNDNHNIRTNIPLDDILPTKPSKHTVLTLDAVEEALEGADRAVVLKCLVEKRVRSWNQFDNVNELLKKIEKSVLEAAAAAAAAEASSSKRPNTRSRAASSKSSGTVSSSRSSRRNQPKPVLGENEMETEANSVSASNVMNADNTSRRRSRAGSGRSEAVSSRNLTGGSSDSMTVEDFLRELSSSDDRSGENGLRILNMLSRTGMTELLRGRIPESLRPRLLRQSGTDSNTAGRNQRTRLHLERLVGSIHESILLGDFVPERTPLWCTAGRTGNTSSQPTNVSSSSSSSSSSTAQEEISTPRFGPDNVTIDCMVASENHLLKPSSMLLESLNRIKEDVSPSTASPGSTSSITSILTRASQTPGGRRSRRNDHTTDAWSNNCRLSYGLDIEASTFLLEILQPGDVVEIEGEISRSPDRSIAVESHFPSCSILGAWISSGKWYWEVEVVRPGLAQIGWASIFFNPNDSRGIGCGDDQHSWAFDGNRKMKWNVDSEEWGTAWKVGDVIGCAIEVQPRTKRATMSFSYNGSWESPMGVAFENILFSGPALRPVITFNRSFKCKIRTQKYKEGPSEVRFSPPSEQYQVIAEVVRFQTPPKDPVQSSRKELENPSSRRRDMSISPVTSPRQGFPSSVVNSASSMGSEIISILSLLTDLSKLHVEKRAIGEWNAMASLQSMNSQRLTQKFVLQIQDALSVCSNSLPKWVWTLGKQYKFLIPLEARVLLFETTAFGISRAAQRIRQDNVVDDQDLQDLLEITDNSESNSRVQSRTRSLLPGLSGIGDGGTETEGRNDLYDENEEDDGNDGEEVVLSQSEDLSGTNTNQSTSQSTEQVQSLASGSPVELSASSSTQQPRNILGSPFSQISRRNTSEGIQGHIPPLSSFGGRDIEPEVGTRLVANIDGSNRGQIGLLRNQKAVVPRNKALDAAMYLLQNKGARQSILSVEFSGETGHGLGPTLEFYSLVCQEMQRRDLELWHDLESGNEGKEIHQDQSQSQDSAEPVKHFVFSPHGLWPKRLPPLTDADKSEQVTASNQNEDSSKERDRMGHHDQRVVNRLRDLESSLRLVSGGISSIPGLLSSGSSVNEVKVERPEVLSTKHTRSRALQLFTFMGRFIGKALQDRRLLDLPLSVPLCKQLLNIPLAIEDIAHIDEKLARSLSYLHSLVVKYNRLVGNSGVDRKEDGSFSHNQQALEQINSIVSNLCLDFTMPGDPNCELIPEGKSVDVTASNLEKYICLVRNELLENSVKEQVEAVKIGLAEFFPVEALQLFTPSELQSILCGGGNAESWQPEEIQRNIICRHGFENDSPQIRNLVEVIASLNKDERRLFMQFLTGSPRLPIGGFGELKPRLTVVKKDVPVPDDHLPSCSTCQVYLKLPAYSSREILEKRLLQAIRDGQGHFALD